MPQMCLSRTTQEYSFYFPSLWFFLLMIEAAKSAPQSKNTISIQQAESKQLQTYESGDLLSLQVMDRKMCSKLGYIFQLQLLAYSGIIICKLLNFVQTFQFIFSSVFQECSQSVMNTLLFHNIFQYFFKRELFTLTFHYLYLYNPTMANRFEYNFTRQSEYQQLRQKVNQLQQENTMLKQSLEELIKVNTQLTESIQELTNNNNINQNHEEIQAKFQMLINENQNLRQELENEKHQNKNHRQGSKPEDEDQTQSLVNVLEELIQSFKNIELKYESEIKQLQERLKDCSVQFEQKIKKVEEQLESKIGTIQAISTQLKHKDQALIHITNKFNQLEKQAMPIHSSTKIMKSQNNDQIKILEKRIEKINKELEQKDKVIVIYEGLFNNLKGKIMEKM